MTINTILVVGSGIMGRGIAYASAIAGYATIVGDVNPDTLNKAKLSIETMIEEGVNRKKLSVEQREDALYNLSYSVNLEFSARLADFVIEAVPEVKAIKQ